MKQDTGYQDPALKFWPTFELCISGQVSGSPVRWISKPDPAPSPAVSKMQDQLISARWFFLFNPIPNCMLCIMFTHILTSLFFFRHIKFNQHRMYSSSRLNTVLKYMADTKVSGTPHLGKSTLTSWCLKGMEFRNGHHNKGPRALAAQGREEGVCSLVNKSPHGLDF